MFAALYKIVLQVLLGTTWFLKNIPLIVGVEGNLVQNKLFECHPVFRAFSRYVNL